MGQSIIAYPVCWLAVGEDGPDIIAHLVCWLAVGEDGPVNYSTSCMLARCRGGWASQL